MKLTNEKKATLEKIYQYYLNDERILKMKEIHTHIGSNCYLHSFRVTKEVMRKAIKSRKDLDLENLLIASILHDYYLYDWRKTKDRPHPHGKHHPFIASENASRDFGISKEVKKIMETHMWPLNFFNPPKGKEASLLCKIDKWVALKECLVPRKTKIRKEKDYLSSISTLF